MSRRNPRCVGGCPNEMWCGYVGCPGRRESPIQLYFSVFVGSLGAERAETEVRPVPLRLRKKLEKLGASEWGRLGYLHRVWVARELRGNGVARELMERTVKLADRIGMSLLLRVAPFDEMGLTRRQLIAFYRSFNFQPLRGMRDVMIR